MVVIELGVDGVNVCLSAEGLFVDTFEGKVSVMPKASVELILRRSPGGFLNHVIADDYTACYRHRADGDVGDECERRSEDARHGILSDDTTKKLPLGS